MAAKPNLAQLVEQLPDTDREIAYQQALEKAAAAQAAPATNAPPTTTAPAPAPQPKPPKPGEGSKFTGPDPEAADKVCEATLAGGPEALRELIGLIRDPAADDFKNYKPEYLLHCLTVFLGRAGQETPRRWFIDALAAQATSERTSLYVRGFLVRELQWIGDRKAVPALGKLLAHEALCDDAARALIAIGDGAAEQFRRALPGATGRRRLILVQSLGAVHDAQSVPALRQALRDEDVDVRLAAAWGLARIGDAGSADLLLKAADVAAVWERIKATQSCLVLAEKLTAAGKPDVAARIYKHLAATRTDPREQYIRDIATKAIAGGLA